MPNHTHEQAIREGSGEVRAENEENVGVEVSGNESDRSINADDLCDSDYVGSDSDENFQFLC